MVLLRRVWATGYARRGAAAVAASAVPPSMKAATTASCVAPTNDGACADTETSHKQAAAVVTTMATLTANTR